MKKNPRTTYAQTSDIKGRSYLEYRRDMKRKAIAELEVLPWIEPILQERHPDQQVRVEKSGGDKFLWFLRTGGVSREPDYIAYIGERQQKIEFQYAEARSLEYYDFKISKVVQTKKRTRVPREDVLFLYIDKPSQKYALLTATWIFENASIGEVPAWRTPGYRVRSETFKPELREDEKLHSVIQSINEKNTLAESVNSLEQAFMASFSLDYLYFCIPPEQELDVPALAKTLNSLYLYIDGCYQQDGAYTDNRSAPCNGTRYALFVVNVVEDMQQDILHYRSEFLSDTDKPKPIQKIYQSLRNPSQTAQFIERNCLRSQQ